MNSEETLILCIPKALTYVLVKINKSPSSLLTDLSAKALPDQQDGSSAEACPCLVLGLAVLGNETL